MNRISYLLCCAVCSLAMPALVAQEPSPSENAVNPVEFNKLLSESKWDEAATIIDTAIAAQPELPSLRSLSLMLANRTMTAQPELSEKRFNGLLEYWRGSPNLSLPAARELSMATNMLSMSQMRQGRPEDAIATIKQSLDSVKNIGDSLRSPRHDLEFNLARLLMNSSKSDEALTLMRSSIDDVKKGINDGKDEIGELVKAASAFANTVDESKEEEVKELNQYVESLLLTKLDSESPKLADLSTYINFRSMQISQLTYSNPTQGVEFAKELMARVDAFSTTDEMELKALDRNRKSVQGLIARLESSLVRERLVGTTAPEFTAESFVAMEETSLKDLRGKVVLLDFWAVWCGPCIATFPHLRDWHDVYSDKGFVILGMTSDQGFTWDESKSQAVRGTNVSHEEELEMLASFHKHHKLRHGFVLTPKGSEYNKQLAVSGIPQAVLIDKQGVIRMIKVGSGPKNAKDLEEAIEKLLAEDTKPAEKSTQEGVATGSSR